MKHLLIIIFILRAFISKAQYPAYTVFGEDQFKGVNIYNVIQDSEKRYYFATDQSIFKYNGYTYEQISCSEMKGVSVFEFAKDSKGVIYCYNLHEQIFRIDKGEIKLIFEIPKESHHHDIWILIDKNDNLFVQAKSIYKISPDGKTYKSSKIK